MSYTVLAVKWRPRRFEDLVGQQHVVRALVNSLVQDRLHHAYLFTGTRGVGKTTVARILAKALNCEQGVVAEPCGVCSACTAIDQGRFVDLLEVDAASRTKVDDTRELLDNVQYAPARGRYKVYLIDEVHMLSVNSFNALLKTLEEPPPHVKFLLATTDPQKLPVTVLSRCLQFNLKRLTVAQIQAQLEKICAAEGITAEPEGLKALAKAADGSMRDALSMLDQGVAFGGGEIKADAINAMLGTIDRGHVLRILEALAAEDGSALLDEVEQLAERAPDFGDVLDDLMSSLQQIAVIQLVGDRLPDEELESLKPLAERMSPEDVQLYFQIALNGRRDLPVGRDPRVGLEMTLLRMLAFRPVPTGAGDVGSSANPAPAPVRAGPSGRSASSARDVSSTAGAPRNDPPLTEASSGSVPPRSRAAAVKERLAAGLERGAKPPFGAARQDGATAARTGRVESPRPRQSEKSGPSGGASAEAPLDAAPHADARPGGKVSSEAHPSRRVSAETEPSCQVSAEPLRDVGFPAESPRDVGVSAEARPSGGASAEARPVSAEARPVSAEVSRRANGLAEAAPRASASAEAQSGSGASQEAGSGSGVSAEAGSGSHVSAEAGSGSGVSAEVRPRSGVSAEAGYTSGASAEAGSPSGASAGARFPSDASAEASVASGVSPETNLESRVSAETSPPTRSRASAATAHRADAGETATAAVAAVAARRRPASMDYDAPPPDYDFPPPDYDGPEAYEPAPYDFHEDAAAANGSNFAYKPGDEHALPGSGSAWDGRWATLIQAADVRGAARQLADHCELAKATDRRLELVLVPEKETLATQHVRARLEAAISQHLGRPITLSIVTGKPPRPTPAQIRLANENERMRRAREAMEQDPNVKAAQEAFGAVLEADTIRPRNAD